MKTSCLLLAGLLLTFLSFAQKQDPVKWSFTSKKINSTTYEIRMSAKVDKGWHIYSQFTQEPIKEEASHHTGCTSSCCAPGPVPTTISFTKNPLVKLNGTAKEVGKLETQFDSELDIEVKQFSNQVDFVQTVTVDPKVTSLSGRVKYRVFNDHKSLTPAPQTFTIELN